MTWKEAYTSLKALYRKLMMDFKWTLSEIDSLDVHFFNEFMEESELLDEFIEGQQPQEKEVYLSDIWL